jgi:hypothetical protein
MIAAAMPPKMKSNMGALGACAERDVKPQADEYADGQTQHHQVGHEYASEVLRTSES